MAAFEVIALDTATPQLRAPGASDTYTFPRAVELPLGTANGVLFLNGSKVVTSGSGLVFDSSGNLGLGVTPSAWSGCKAFELSGVGSAIWSTGTSDMRLSSNVYFDGTNARYAVGNLAGQFRITTGEHQWFTAPSGTAGNAISFTQAMTLTASGNLLLGTTTEIGSGRLRVVDSIRVADAGTETNALLITTSGSAATIETRYSTPLVFGTGAIERARIPATGGIVVGTAALNTTATDGFLYVPTCAGTPTGTPTTQTGTAPIVVNTTNNKLYFYSGGQWRDAGP